MNGFLEVCTSLSWQGLIGKHICLSRRCHLACRLPFVGSIVSDLILKDIFPTLLHFQYEDPIILYLFARKITCPAAGSIILIMPLFAPRSMLANRKHMAQLQFVSRGQSHTKLADCAALS
jgi:hypothetical protein